MVFSLHDFDGLWPLRRGPNTSLDPLFGPAPSPSLRSGSGSRALHNRLTECWQLHQIILRDRLKVAAGFAPGSQTANDDECLESLVPQYVRHPGARGFARSSTVEVNILVLWEVLNLLLKVIGLDPNRSPDPLGANVVIPVAANVDDQHAITCAGRDPLGKLLGMDPRYEIVLAIFLVLHDAIDDIDHERNDDDRF